MELFEVDLAWGSCLDLREDLCELFVGEVLTLATETLCQVLFCDVACVVNIEVMECEGQVSLSDSLSAIDGDGQEFGVINLAVMVEINALEDLVYLFLGHLKLVEGGSYFVKAKIA